MADLLLITLASLGGTAVALVLALPHHVQLRAARRTMADGKPE